MMSVSSTPHLYRFTTGSTHPSRYAAKSWRKLRGDLSASSHSCTNGSARGEAREPARPISWIAADAREVAQLDESAIAASASGSPRKVRDRFQRGQVS